MASEKSVTDRASVQQTTEEERPNPSYRGLYRFCRRADFALLIPAVAVSTASGLLNPAFTVLLGKIFTSFGAFSKGTISANELERQVTQFVIGICILGAAAWCIGWAHMSLWLAFGENTARGAREQIMKGLLQKSVTWYDKKGVENGVSGNMNKAIKYSLHLHC